MANRKLIVEIVGDADSLQRTFRQVGHETQTFGAKLGQIAKGAVVAAGALGVTGLAFAVATGTKELREQQRVAAQTAAAIKSTGGVANVTAKHINDLGLALSNLSGVDDELIKSGANLLLSFENIRNSAGKGNAIFDRATKAVLDFSVRTGRDVPAAAVLLGKALEDPATKVSALARAGIVFSTAQKKVISDLVKTGHALEAQKIILGELEERFGGAAKAAGATLPGRLRVLQERFQDLTGDLLTAFLPSLNRAVIVVTGIVKSFSAWSAKSENQRRMQEIVNDVVDKAVAVFQGLRDVLVPIARVAGRVTDALGGMRRSVQLLVAAFVAARIVSFAGALTGLSAQALVASGRVSALRIALLRLGAIGVITLGVEVILNRKSIDRSVTNFLREHRLGFLAGGSKLELPADITVPDLEKVRGNIAKLKGESDLMVVGLGKVIDALHKLDDLRFAKAMKQAQALRERLDGIKSKKVSIGVVERGLDRVRKQLDGVKDKRVVGYQITQHGIEELERKLRGVKGKTIDVTVAESGLAEVRRGLASLRDKTVHVTIDIETFTHRPEEGTRGTGVGAQAFARKRAADVAAQTAKDEAAAQTAAANAAAAARKAGARAVARAAAAAAKAAAAATTAFENLIDSFNLKLDQARVTASFNDDLKVLHQIQAQIKKRMAEVGKTVDLQRQLFDVEQQIAQAQRDQAQAIRDRKQGKLFEALGLTAEGDKKTPGSGSLIKRAQSLKQQIKGTALDTPKTQAQLSEIVSVLKNNFKTAGQQVRAAILDMLNVISGALSGKSGGGAGAAKLPRTKNVSGLFKDLGLDPDEIKKVRREAARAFGLGGRVAGSRTGGALGVAVSGGGGVVITGPVTVVANDPQQLLKQLQKRGQRNAGARTGTRASQKQ